MKLDAVRSIISGNIQAINQGMSLIQSLSDHQYQYVASPYVKSTIGQHFRHVVDMFFAITASARADLIDYDKRRRGAEIEVDRTGALKQLKLIRGWMENYLINLEQDPSALRNKVDIKTEVTLKETHSVVLPSTLMRELVFTSSHAVHHYALISVIAKLQGVPVVDNFGVAPATATFLRHEDPQAETQQLCAR